MSKKLEALIEGLNILETTGDLQTVVKGIAYDSRKVGAGDLFVAVRGTKVDGTAYIPEALKRGAEAIVAEEIPPGLENVPFIRVEDSRKALAQIAAVFFDNPSRSFRLIGVTGTNGKTTTTLLLEAILKQAGHRVGVLGTLAYRWGEKSIAAPMTTPESLDLHDLFSRMREDSVSHVVMEVSSHALALGRVDGCLFGVGIFTNLSQDHLDFHETMED
ncbi:MAG: Mur ligase family protein, partial [Acidobacteriota bacterium]